ncbi:MAG: PAS domain S-box protein [Thermicanus sp.]|nr:PAS domain S-box protein [Thermicanus sp.]
MKSLRFRLTAGSILMIGLLLFALAIYNGRVLEETVMNQLEVRLEKEANLLAKSVDWPALFLRLDTLNSELRRFSSAGEVRITLISPTGEVLGDSHADYKKMGNHANREEILQAKESGLGKSIRWSDTMGKRLIYVAIPLEQGGERIGYLRLAYSVEQIKRVVYQGWIAQGVVFLVALFLFSLLSSRLVRNISRPIEKMSEVARDITKRKFGTTVQVEGAGEIADLSRAINFMSISLEQQVKKISEDEKLFNDVMRNMVSGVILVNEKGRIRLANRAVSIMLGIGEEEMIGHLHIEAIKNFALSQLIDQVFEKKEKVRGEINIYYPEERVLDINIAPLFSDDEKLSGAVLVLHDITDIRRLERVRSEFVANASHELKTPVTSIKGFAETLLDGAMYEEESLKSFLTIIYNESERLQRLIQDILDLSKIEQKKLPLELKKFPIYSLIEEIVPNVRREIEKKGITFRNEIPPHLLIEADFDRTKQLFKSHPERNSVHAGWRGDLGDCRGREGRDNGSSGRHGNWNSCEGSLPYL